jgi:hypothetical protein
MLLLIGCETADSPTNSGAAIGPSALYLASGIEWTDLDAAVGDLEENEWRPIRRPDEASVLEGVQLFAGDYRSIDQPTVVIGFLSGEAAENQVALWIELLREKQIVAFVRRYRAPGHDGGEQIAPGEAGWAMAPGEKIAWNCPRNVGEGAPFNPDFHALIPPEIDRGEVECSVEIRRADFVRRAAEPLGGGT